MVADGVTREAEKPSRLYLAAHANLLQPDELLNVRDFHNSETYATPCPSLKEKLLRIFSNSASTVKLS